MKLKTNLDGEIAANVEKCLSSMGRDTPFPPEGLYKIFKAEGRTFDLDRDGIRAYNEILDLLKQRGELDKILSDKEIDRQVQQFLGRVYVKFGITALRKSIKQEFREWWNELHLMPVKTVTYYYVVEGIALAQELCIGTARLQRLDMSRYEAFGQELFDRLDANLYYCSSAKHWQKQSIMRNWMPHFEPDGRSALVLVSVTVGQRDSEFGYITARARLDELVDFLRFLALQKQSDLQRPIPIAVRNQIGNQLHVSFAAHDDGGWQLSARNDGRPDVMLNTITPELTAFFVASLAKDERDRSQVENKLIRAMVYLGKAAAELLPANQLLSAWFSLEALVNNQEERMKGNVLCARMAALLSKDTVQFEQQESLLTSAYRVRNRIVHQGVSRLSEDERRLIAQVKQRAFLAVSILAEAAMQTGMSEVDHLDECIKQRHLTIGASA
jgi:hypothetical protein